MMVPTLDPVARRVLGVLLEKEATTPNQYPLTLSALVQGCNQRSNRDPVTDLGDSEVEEALRRLRGLGWVTARSQSGSRTVRWRHDAKEKTGLAGRELAVLAELLLRGSQQPGELRTRVSRMVPIPDLEKLEIALGVLEERGFARRLDRRPGERAQRIDHCMHGEDEEPEVPAAPPRPEPTRSEPTPAPSPEPSADLAERLARLEARVAALEERLRAEEDLAG